MNNKWFHIYRGVAHSVEHIEENSMTTAVNFHLEVLPGSLVSVPGQANNLPLIKEKDTVEICGRPALFDKNKTVCLAYRINYEDPVRSINEVRHLSMVILGFIFGLIYVTYSGWKWPLTIIVAVSIHYATSWLLSLYARRCLARVGAMPVEANVQSESAKL